jgi:hypothetical protein
MKSITIFAALLTLALSSCNEETTTSVESSSNGNEGALLAILLPTLPEGALTITEARKNPTPGTKVVLSGKIMGNESPLVDSRAMLTLGDPTKLTSCDLNPDDPCETPWDVCCDDLDLRKASIATIQVLGANGKPFKTGLRGLGGLRELSSLVIVGEVAQGSNKDNFLVTATGIHVAMAEPTKENPARLAAPEPSE